MRHGACRLLAILFAAATPVLAFAADAREAQPGRVVDVGDARWLEEAADPVLLAFGCKQHEARVRGADSQLDPPLLFVEGLVGDDGEAEFLGVEIERTILVVDGNADEFNLPDHAWKPTRPTAWASSGEAWRRGKGLSVYR